MTAFCPFLTDLLSIAAESYSSVRQSAAANVAEPSQHQSEVAVQPRCSKLSRPDVTKGNESTLAADHPQRVDVFRKKKDSESSTGSF